MEMWQLTIVAMVAVYITEWELAICVWWQFAGYAMLRQPGVTITSL